jgi:hypothetical protein
MGSPTAPALEISADLEFSLDAPGDRTVTGVLRGSGTALELTVSDPSVFAGRGDARILRGLAAALADRGMSVRVVAPSGPLVTLGARRTPWWQRRVTGSRHIRIERGARLWSLALGRVRATAGALPSSDLVPPPVLWPPAPTFIRRPRTVATTHDPDRGGNPRLIMAPSPAPGPDDRQAVHALTGRRFTTIGSDPDCDIVLRGLDPVHAVVHHDDLDEFVVYRRGEPGTLCVNGAPVDRSVLRTASRMEVGRWTMSFYREEYADHGRPHGGRIGGELGRQKPQPPRPSRGAVS